MTALVALVLALAASCEHPALAELTPERQATACELLAVSGPPQRSVLGLHEVYERAGFEHARERDSSALNAWLLQLRAKLLAFFETSGAEKYSNVTRVVVLVVALLLIALGVARFAAARRRKVSTATKDQRGSEARLVLESAGQHLARAESLIESAPREALRQGLFALLSWLEAQHYARPDRVKTNRELVSELPVRGASAGLVDQVRAMCEFYDSAFYSLEPVSAADARSFVQRVGPLVEART